MVRTMRRIILVGQHVWVNQQTEPMPRDHTPYNNAESHGLLRLNHAISSKIIGTMYPLKRHTFSIFHEAMHLIWSPLACPLLQMPLIIKDQLSAILVSMALPFTRYFPERVNTMTWFADNSRYAILHYSTMYWWRESVCQRHK